MNIYKNAPSVVLRLERHELANLYRAWSDIYCQSDKLDGPANEGLGIIGRAIRLRIEAIDAELATWTAPLPELTESPTAMAS